MANVRILHELRLLQLGFSGAMLAQKFRRQVIVGRCSLQRFIG